MSENFELNPELAELESRLQGIPVPESRLDHDRVMYDAGYAAALADAPDHPPVPGTRGSAGFWQAATGGLTIVAASLAALLFLDPGNTQPAPMETARTEAAGSPAQTGMELENPDQRKTVGGTAESDSTGAPSVDRIRVEPNRPAVWQADVPLVQIRRAIARYDWFELHNKPTPVLAGSARLPRGARTMNARELLNSLLN